MQPSKMLSIWSCLLALFSLYIPGLCADREPAVDALPLRMFCRAADPGQLHAPLARLLYRTRLRRASCPGVPGEPGWQASLLGQCCERQRRRRCNTWPTFRFTWQRKPQRTGSYTTDRVSDEKLDVYLIKKTNKECKADILEKRECFIRV